MLPALTSYGSGRSHQGPSFARRRIAIAPALTPAQKVRVHKNDGCIYLFDNRYEPTDDPAAVAAGHRIIAGKDLIVRFDPQRSQTILSLRSRRPRSRLGAMHRASRVRGSRCGSRNRASKFVRKRALRTELEAQNLIDRIELSGTLPQTEPPARPRRRFCGRSDRRLRPRERPSRKFSTARWIFTTTKSRVENVVRAEKFVEDSRYNRTKTLLTEVFASPSSMPKVIVAIAAAGVGKTTLLRYFCVQLRWVYFPLKEFQSVAWLVAALAGEVCNYSYRSIQENYRRYSRRAPRKAARHCLR